MTKELANEPIVWGIGTTRTMRVHLMLLEFGVPYQTRAIKTRTPDMETAEFQALNPKGKIPVLQHNDLTLTESAAIAGYIAEVFPAPRDFFIPTTAAERAAVNEWCFFIMTELDAHSLYLIRRHLGLAHIYGAAPDAVASAKEYFYKLINAKAGHFSDGRLFLFGDRWSVADVLLMSIVEWLGSIDFAMPEFLEGFASNMRRRPAYQQAHIFNYPDRPYDFSKV
jgi:glutathione S-transferase